MPEIIFSVDPEDGTSSMKIVGIKGKACKPIHDAIARDMEQIGIVSQFSEDTPEMRESETVQLTNRLQLRS